MEDSTVAYSYVCRVSKSRVHHYKVDVIGETNGNKECSWLQKNGGKLCKTLGSYLKACVIKLINVKHIHSKDAIVFVPTFWPSANK